MNQTDCEQFAQSLRRKWIFSRYDDSHTGTEIIYSPVETRFVTFSMRLKVNDMPSHYTGWPKKNRTHKNFTNSYKDPVNFEHFAGFKLQSVDNHSPKYQSLKTLLIKVLFFPKICSKWPLRRWRQTCIRLAKLSMFACFFVAYWAKIFVTVLTRAAHWMTYFDLSKLKFKLIYWKLSNPNCSGNRRDKVVLRTTCIKNVKFWILKIRTSCEYVLQNTFTTVKT